MLSKRPRCGDGRDGGGDAAGAGRVRVTTTRRPRRPGSSSPPAAAPSEVSQQESTTAKAAAGDQPRDGQEGRPGQRRDRRQGHRRHGQDRRAARQQGQGRVGRDARGRLGLGAGQAPQEHERYEATVIAADPAGTATKTASTTFTTMGKPGRKTGTGLYLFDDHTYGVAMPVVAEFSPGHQEGRPGGRTEADVRQDRPAAARHLVVDLEWHPGLLPRAGVLEAGHRADRAARRRWPADRRRAVRRRRTARRPPRSAAASS